MSADLLRIKKFCDETGWSEKSIRRMIEKGVWINGREYVRMDNRRILVSVRGYEAWVNHDRKAVPRTLRL